MNPGLLSPPGSHTLGYQEQPMVTLPGHGAFRYACNDPGPCAPWVVREAMLPAMVKTDLAEHLRTTRGQHEDDLSS